MRKLFTLLIFFQIFFEQAKTQYNNPPLYPSDSTPANCNWDLTDSIFTTIVVKNTSMNAIVYGETSMSSDYHDASFVRDGKDHGQPCVYDGCSGKNENYADTLKIYVYYPKHNYDYVSGGHDGKLPAFIFVHGGGFSDCSSASPPEVNCKEMAYRGFVSFNVEYRRGREKDSIVTSSVAEYRSEFQSMAIYRAIQDVRGAIRYIIYRQDHHNDIFSDDPYQIDTSKIFLGGSSAGALTILGASYFYQTSSQTKLSAVFPLASSSVDVVMGDINRNFYLGDIDTTTNFMQHVKGILSEWGAVYVPANKFDHPDSFFSSIPYKPPVIAFNGVHDPVFNYDAEWIAFSPTVDANSVSHAYYNNTSSCTVSGSFALEGSDATTHDMYSLGMKGFYDKVLVPLQIKSEYYLDCQMEHGPQDDCGTPGCYVTEFGTGIDNKHDILVYMMQRTAIFFQNIMNNSLGNRTKTGFIECANYRIQCGSDDHAPTGGCPALVDY
jgi:acetyl esterase/lipase